MTSPITVNNNLLSGNVGDVSTGTGLPILWRNGVTRIISLGHPPIGWVRSSDGAWYPPATWKNGITKQSENGQPPAGWELQNDGFYYPPTLPYTPTISNPLARYIVLSPVAQSIIERNYNRGTLQQIDSVSISATNTSNVLSILVAPKSITGVSFTPSQAVIEPSKTVTFIATIDPVRIEALPDGIHDIEIFLQLSLAVGAGQITTETFDNQTIIPRPRGAIL